MIAVVSALAIAIGVLFFVAGTIGLLRFPDTFTRLHALTKADNLGLGFIVLGLALQQDAVLPILKLGGIWLLALLGSSSACYLLGEHALERRPPGQTAEDRS
jgi:multicomponent Na+:H+ antiporter subunit G